MKTKLSALILAVTIVLSTAGCAASPAVMTYEGKTVTINMYRYWLSSYKGSFMNTYTDMSDTDTFWDSILYGDVTAEEYLNTAVAENVRRTLVCSAQFDLLGLTFPDSAKDEIDQYIEELIEERADGSRNSFNQILSQYGINIDMLRQIYTMEDKTSLLFSYLYGEGGANALSEADYASYCENNYVRVRHMYVNNAYAYEVNEDGYYSYDTSGVLKTRALTDAEQAEKAEKIAAIDAALEAGEDFEAVYDAYSEDHYYENGYYLSGTTSFIPEVISAAFSLEIGQWQKLETDYGTHYILRLAMDEKPYEDEDNSDFFSSFESDAKNDHFLHWMEDLIREVEVDEELLDRYSIRDVSPNYSI